MLDLLQRPITIEGDTALAFTEDVATRFIGLGWNVTRVGDANDLGTLSRAFRDFQSRGPPTHAHHRRQPHRLRLPQAGHCRRARRTARRRRRPPTKRFYGWPEDAPVPRAGPGLRSSGRRRGCPRGRARGEWMTTSNATAPSIRNSPSSSSACSTGPCPTAGTPSSPVPDRYQGTGQPRLLRQGAQRTRAARAVARGRVGRPRTLDQDPARLWRSGISARTSPAGRNLHLGVREFAGAAVPNGLALSKVRPFWSTFLIFSDFAQGDSALRADGDPGRARVHPRLHRRWRGRADPSARRAGGFPARDPGCSSSGPATPTRSPRRGGSSWACDTNPLRSSSPASRSRPGPHGYGPASGLRSRRLCADRRRRRPAGGHPAGHRQRGAPRARRPRAAHRRRHPRPRGEHALLGVA